MLPFQIPVIGRLDHFEIISRVWCLRDVRSFNTYQFPPRKPETTLEVRFVCDKVHRTVEKPDKMKSRSYNTFLSTDTSTIIPDLKNYLHEHDQMWWDHREMEQFMFNYATEFGFIPLSNPSPSSSPGNLTNNNNNPSLNFTTLLKLIKKPNLDQLLSHSPLEHNFFYNSNLSLTFPKSNITNSKHWYLEELNNLEKQRKNEKTRTTQSNVHDPETITLHPIFHSRFPLLQRPTPNMNGNRSRFGQVAPPTIFSQLPPEFPLVQLSLYHFHPILRDSTLYSYPKISSQLYEIHYDFDIRRITEIFPSSIFLPEHRHMDTSIPLVILTIDLCNESSIQMAIWAYHWLIHSYNSNSTLFTKTSSLSSSSSSSPSNPLSPSSTSSPESPKSSSHYQSTSNQTNPIQNNSKQEHSAKISIIIFNASLLDRQIVSLSQVQQWFGTEFPYSVNWFLYDIGLEFLEYCQEIREPDEIFEETDVIGALTKKPRLNTSSWWETKYLPIVSRFDQDEAQINVSSSYVDSSGQNQVKNKNIVACIETGEELFELDDDANGDTTTTTTTTTTHQSSSESPQNESQHEFQSHESMQLTRSIDEQANVNLATFLDKTFIDLFYSRFLDRFLNQQINTDTGYVLPMEIEDRKASKLKLKCPVQSSLRYPHETLKGSELGMVDQIKDVDGEYGCHLAGIGGVLNNTKTTKENNENEKNSSLGGSVVGNSVKQTKATQPTTTSKGKPSGASKTATTKKSTTKNPKVPKKMHHWCCLDLLDNINLDLDINNNPLTANTQSPISMDQLNDQQQQQQQPQQQQPTLNSQSSSDPPDPLLYQQHQSTQSQLQSMNSQNSRFETRNEHHSCSKLTFSWTDVPNFYPKIGNVAQDAEWNEKKVKTLLDGLTFDFLSMPFEVEPSSLSILPEQCTLADHTDSNTNNNKNNDDDDVRTDAKNDVEDQNTTQTNNNNNINDGDSTNQSNTIPNNSNLNQIHVIKQRLMYEIPSSLSGSNPYPKLKLQNTRSLIIEHHTTPLLDKFITDEQEIVLNHLGQLHFRQEKEQIKSALLNNVEKNKEEISHTNSIDVYRSFQTENRMYSMMFIDEQTKSIIDVEKSIFAKKKMGLMIPSGSNPHQSVVFSDVNDVNHSVVNIDTNVSSFDQDFNSFPETTQLFHQFAVTSSNLISDYATNNQINNHNHIINNENDNHNHIQVKKKHHNMSHLLSPPHHFQVEYDSDLYTTPANYASHTSSNLFSFSLINLSTFRKEIEMISKFRSLIFPIPSFSLGRSFMNIFSSSSSPTQQSSQNVKILTRTFNNNSHTYDNTIQTIDTYDYMTGNHKNNSIKPTTTSKTSSATNLTPFDRLSFLQLNSSRFRDINLNQSESRLEHQIKVMETQTEQQWKELSSVSSSSTTTTTTTTTAPTPTPPHQKQQQSSKPHTVHRCYVDLPSESAIHMFDFKQLGQEYVFGADEKYQFLSNYSIIDPNQKLPKHIKSDDILRIKHHDHLAEPFLNIYKQNKKFFGSERIYVQREVVPHFFIVVNDEDSVVHQGFNQKSTNSSVDLIFDQNAGTAELMNSYLLQAIPQGYGISPLGSHDTILHYSFTKNQTDDEIRKTLTECMKSAVGVRMDHYDSMMPKIVFNE